MPSKEQQLLDELEDAKNELRRHRRIVALLITAMIVSTMLFVGGVTVGQWGTFHHVDTGGLAIGMIIPSVVATIGTGLALVAHYDGLGYRSPQTVLLRAQRDYRDYLLEQL